MATVQLTIEHLAPYVPYNPKVFYYNGETGYLKDELVRDICGFINERIHTYKPILRPLSDLTKEIEIDGVKFVPIYELFIKSLPTGTDTTRLHKKFNVFVEGDSANIRCMSFLFGYDFLDNSFVLCLENSDLPVSHQRQLFEMLFKWHIDVFGLIDKNQAIDINTLK